MAFQPADSLKSRTFVGLLVAQFLAAFNDQAIHASAMFFAINQQTMTEATAISLMPILFYAPWAVFCTLAGYLADRYSKRQSLVVWKIAEVAITLVAFGGFWLGTHGNAAGPWVVLSTVFLMGTHSAFFVPAKYGAMPEILQPHLLSRGNGLLESLSFLAVILGTVSGGVLSYLFLGREYVIGAILVVLAIVGAVASLLIEKMPAANPTRPFPPYVFQPLVSSLRMLVRSRPLLFALLGLAFFTFVVAFMRQTVYMHGESRVPRWTEFKTSVVVGVVALGIGLGSPMAGFFSGGKVELGLIPVGAVGMILCAVGASFAVNNLVVLMACIVLIGFFTGFYIVPLFTLMQHRAPKTGKGEVIATSNFVNVTGAIVASLLFYALVFAAEATGVTPRIELRDRWAEGELERLDYNHGRPVYFEVREKDGGRHRAGKPNEGGQEPGADDFFESEPPDPKQINVVKAARGMLPRRSVRPGGAEDGLPDGQAPSRVVVSNYSVHGVAHYDLRHEGQALAVEYNQEGLPRLLFVGAGAMTLVTLLLLTWQLPDLLVRAMVWARSLGRYRVKAVDMHYLPTSGPAVLVTDCAGVEQCLQVLSATDRYTRFLMVSDAPGLLGRGISLAVLRPGRAGPDAWGRALGRAAEALDRGQIVAVPANANGAAAELEKFVEDLQGRRPVPVVPVHCGPGREPGQVLVVYGPPLSPGAALGPARREVERLAVGAPEDGRNGAAATPSAAHA